MEPKDIAKQIIANAGKYRDELIALKVATENLVKKAAQENKVIIEDIDTDDKLVKVLAEVADEAYKGKGLKEALDGPAAHVAFSGMNKYVVVKFAGLNWWVKFREWLKSVLAV